MSSSYRLRTVLSALISDGVTLLIRVALAATASSWRRSARIAVMRGVKSSSSTGGSDSIAEPKVFTAATTACAISGISSPPEACGVSFSVATDSPRRSRAIVPWRPSQDFLELCSGSLPRPAPALFERDQRAGVDDAVGRKASLTDVQFAPARGRRGTGADHPGFQHVRRLIGRLRVGHVGQILGHLMGRPAT